MLQLCLTRWLSYLTLFFGIGFGFGESLQAQPLATPDSILLVVQSASGDVIPFASVGLSSTPRGSITDLNGAASLRTETTDVSLSISSVGFERLDTVLRAGQKHIIQLRQTALALDEVVVSGTLQPTLRTESPVPVEVYTRNFLVQEPTVSLFEALERVNGVRPQLNCAVCGTGDIHINGLEGPYTMVTIDGMPMVSGLATVYGLEGIPSALIERIEVVKGPASTLYGSEAVGGLINVITRQPDRAPRISADVFVTGLGDVNVDLGGLVRLSPKLSVLTGAQAYFYDLPRDQNGDGFTDATLSQRLSLFQRWAVTGGVLEGMSLAGRYLTESRWGGQLTYGPAFRGGDQVYGEAIDTRRVEVFGKYSPTAEPRFALNFSFNTHQQQSDYGTLYYQADQRVGFAQATWVEGVGEHELLGGISTRYTYYDDNSFATQENGRNTPDEVWLPGIFIQDDWRRGRHRILTGLRLDLDSRHGPIITPRFAYKMPAGEGANVRLNIGTGFRVVNLFTEEHAALSGARTLIIEEKIAPEKSVNGNLSYAKNWYPNPQSSFTLEAATWATRFSNQIIPDYLSDATEIRYRNLDGFSLNHGFSLEGRFQRKGFSSRLGITYADTQIFEETTSSPTRPLLSERWSASWSVSQSLGDAQMHWLGKNSLRLDYSGTLYGPMLLPVQNELDPRASESPWWSLQSIQGSFQTAGQLEFYLGIKNILDFTPEDNTIARAFDPFDRQVSFDSAGVPLPDEQNPAGLVFDPSYVYAPFIGRRWFVGLRYTLR